MVDIARAYLAGHVRAVDAARQLTALIQSSTRVDDFMLGFVGIDSETHTFPLGAAREMWSQVALVREDAQMDKYERDIAGRMAELCEKLIEELGGVTANNSLQLP